MRPGRGEGQPQGTTQGEQAAGGASDTHAFIHLHPSFFLQIAESILEAPQVSLPASVTGHLSPHFSSFIAGAMAKHPGERLPADILLGSSWFTACGIDSLENAGAIMAEFLHGLHEAANGSSAGGDGAGAGSHGATSLAADA